METKMKIDIGIEASKREEIAGGLSQVLADTYTLYLKTHNFHWNVTGPMFQTLHLMFETHYNELALAVDLVRRTHPRPGIRRPAHTSIRRALPIKEEPGVPKAQDMIRLLVEGHEAVARTARKAFRTAERRRPTHLRSAHPAYAGPREDRLDAAQPARVAAERGG